MLLLQQIAETLRDKGIKKIGIEAPYGLKKKAVDVARYFRNKGFFTVVVIDGCYGACDTYDRELKDIVQHVIHLGHKEIKMEREMGYTFIDVDFDFDIKKLKEEMEKLNYKRLGVFSDVQHVKKLEEIKKIAKLLGFEVKIGKDGYVLGCDYSAVREIENEVDAFLFIGTGEFHPVGASIVSKKPVFAYDTERGKIKRVNSEKFVRKRYGAMARAGKKVGFIVSMKKGQYVDPEYYIELGKKRFEIEILASFELKEFELYPFDCDFFVFFGCPRVPIEEGERFKKPVLTPAEFELLIKGGDYKLFEIER